MAKSVVTGSLNGTEGNLPNSSCYTGLHNYRLVIPGRAIHDVFHVDRLRPYVDPASFPSRPHIDRPPPVLAETNEYEVDRIVDSRRSCRRNGGRMEYFVYWKGYGKEDTQWTDSAQFDIDDTVVLAFRSAHPTKPHHGG